MSNPFHHSVINIPQNVNASHRIRTLPCRMAGSSLPSASHSIPTSDVLGFLLIFIYGWNCSNSRNSPAPISGISTRTVLPTILKFCVRTKLLCQLLEAIEQLKRPVLPLHTRDYRF